MRLVVDTNVLFTFFWKRTVTRKFICRLELYAPEYALEEINKYKAEILRKAKITDKEFDAIRAELATVVDFVPLEEYAKQLRKAQSICPDPNDVDFFALALRVLVPLWSNDKLLKNQKTLTVVSTSDLLNNPEVSDVLFPMD